MKSSRTRKSFGLLHRSVSHPVAAQQILQSSTTSSSSSATSSTTATSSTAATSTTVQETRRNSNPDSVHGMPPSDLPRDYDDRLPEDSRSPSIGSVGTGLTAHQAAANIAHARPNRPDIDRVGQNRDELFDLIEGMQSRRLEEQRAPMPALRRSYTTNGPQSLAGK